jgi:malate dehydrogenase
MTTVAIIGAGDIGGAAAHAITASDHVSRVRLIDPAAQAAQGKALDLSQAAPVLRFHTSLYGTDDVSQVTGCDVCIIADRFAGAEWRGDEGLALVNRITPYLGHAPIVFAGPSCGDLIARSVIEVGIDRRRVIGSGVEALASAVAGIVAVEAGCSPREVMLTVLGVPPRGFVVPWTEASIGGYALQDVVPQSRLARAQSRVPHLWPPGPYALGAAAARIAAAIVSESRRMFSVLTQLDGEFGARNRPGAVSARLGSSGILRTRIPELTTRERVLLQIALGG